MFLVVLPWARMVPPPEILEAFCRVYSSNEGGGGGGDPNNGNGPDPGQSANATITQTTVIPWPQPPTIATSEGTNREYFSNYPVIGGGREVGNGIGGRESRVPGEVYGENMKEVIPKHAKVHRITIPEDYSKNKQQQQSYPRQLLLSPSSSPLREKFTREEESTSQPLPVFVQDTATNDDQYQQQQPKRNSRSFIFSSGGGIQPMGYNNLSSTTNKRASLVSLSTISEVGDDENGLGNTRSVYRNSVWHPRNSILGVIRSPLSIDYSNHNHNKEEEDDEMGVKSATLHHTSWESTHSSTHSALASTSSSDSISLPPHLIPIAPPKSAPLPQTTTPASAKMNLPTSNETNQGTYGLQPKIRQSSTCSVRSHWSDDSDHGVGITANKNHRFVGTLRGRREGSKSSTRADSLEWD